MILKIELPSTIVEIDLRNLYYVLLDGYILRLSDMRIMEPINSVIHFINHRGHVEVEPLSQSEGTYIHLNNGRYENIDLLNHVCYGSEFIKNEFLSYCTNDLIWELYQSYREDHTGTHKLSPLCGHCDKIVRVIDGISLYNVIGEF